MNHSDLHVHLYGCLSASDVWLLGRRTYRSNKESLNQYAQFYQISWNREAQLEDYWKNNKGFQSLKKDFNVVSKTSFAKFQACFNLIIALFPIDPKDTNIPYYILFKLSKQKLRYVEPRIVFPERFTSSDMMTYLTTLSKVAKKVHAKNHLRVCFVVSLSRKQNLYNYQYDVIKKWLKTYPQYKKFVAGIDFASYEEDFPPSEKKVFIQKVLTDNQKRPNTALAIMYHVGESFSKISLMSACRWIWQVHSYGVHRLSHCIALGIEPKLMLGKIVKEPIMERREHLSWLMENKESLKSNGYIFCQKDVLHELLELKRSKQQTVRIIYTHKLVEDIRKLQNTLLTILKNKKIIIEVCPISNYRIGMMTSYHQHSLLRFIKHKINICLGSDDPGILDFDREMETNFCKDKLKISNLCLNKMFRSQISYESERLSGRLFVEKKGSDDQSKNKNIS